MPLVATPCPCGSNLEFALCCQPLIERQSRARTAEALMRSRYTAYVLGCSEYILETWAPATRPRSLDLSIDQVKWLGLEIHGGTGGLEGESEGEVEFTAGYISAGFACSMRENSRFISLADSWYYLDGRCETARKKLDRNSPCPCRSGKKFKRCCGLQ